MALTIKSKYKNTIVGFNKSAKPLGERDDLHLLYELGKQNKKYLEYFDNPTEQDVEESRDKQVVNNPKFNADYEKDKNKT